MKHITPAIAALMLSAITFTACSDDDYESRPPRIANLEINVLERDANGQLVATNSEEVHVGDYFTVTAKQKTIGHLLNATTYAWTNSKGFSQRYRQSVIYDKYEEGFNSADTLYASESGTCKVSFSGKYKASGSTNEWAKNYGSVSSETTAEGTNVTYTVGGIFYFTVAADRTFTIKP